MLNTRCNNLIIAGIVALLCVGMAGTALAQTKAMKVGFIDLQQIIDASQEGKIAQENIKKRADELSQRAKSMKAELQQMRDEYEKQAMALTPEARSQKRDEISRFERDYNRFLQDSKTDIRVAEQRALKELLEDVGKLVVTYGKTNNYTVIFEKSGILYGADEIDITGDIIELYNAR